MRAATQIMWLIGVGVLLVGGCPTTEVPDEPVNYRPVASAGADVNACLNDTVTLTSAGSTDVDGDGLTYVWVQTLGEHVDLTGATGLQPTFEALLIGTFEFTVTVNDGQGGSDSDTVRVAVSDCSSGGGQSNPPPEAVSVAILPATATVTIGQTQQFTANVENATNLAVTWSIDKGPAWGTMSASGLYTAPATAPTPAQVTITATSVADSTRSATAQVTIIDAGSPTVSIQVTPATATLELGQTQQFQANVTGTADTAVTWSVDEGPTSGSVDVTGLYTTPATLPAAAYATVRATSVADPTRSAAAQVTLTEPAQGGPSATEQASYTQLFSEGGEVVSDVNSLTRKAASAVFEASTMNGGVETLTGTLTQVSQEPEQWTYSPTPADKLVVSIPGQTPIEFHFSAFDGHKQGDAGDFVDTHDNLDFIVVVDGLFNLHIQSSSVPTTGEKYNWARKFSRTITGNAVYEGQMHTVDLTYEGTQEGEVDYNWAASTWGDECRGTITAGTTALTISESYWGYYTYWDGKHVFNRGMTNNSSATIGGVTLKFQEAKVRWEKVSRGPSSADDGYRDVEYAFNKVAEPDYWYCQGNLLRNGQAIGTVEFDGPVVYDTKGPDLILRLNTGEAILLHPLIYP
ncbi:MAG: Ig-like domain-containing protein [Planctomycetes bacterium]|nr:Ig-like domain-containing protein [Planctomycetota bacterium]